MACRNCTDICNCAVQAGVTNTNLTVTGSGTAADPYVVTAASQKMSDTYTYPSTLVVGAGTVRRYFSHAGTFTNVVAGVGTQPTGASILVDINKNGTTIFTTQANRPTILASTSSDTSSVPDVTTFVAGDYLTVDIDQIGAGVAGADLVIVVEYTR